MRCAEAIAVDALALPTRAALVLRLTESLDEQHDADAEDAWAAEVAARVGAVAPSEEWIQTWLAECDRRVAGADSGAEAPVPWNEA